jgi:DNA-binding SARP family transcriptional activator/tetratricopeptide (TPR) repeat protein
MEYEVLGPLRLRRDGETVTPPGRLQRRLLAILLARANQPVSVDLLTDALWDGQPDERVEQKLQLHVHRLRRMLDAAERLTFGPGGYQLRVLPDELDAERFEGLLEEATPLTTAEPTRAVELIRKALELWRGTPYGDVETPSLVAETQRLTDRRLAATEALYQARLGSGEDAAIVADLTDEVRRHPLRERLWALLMVALYRSGRQADALEAYQDARRTLVDELGLEPGPELRSVEQGILAGEPVEVGATPAAPVPAQLPPSVGEFVGRDAELAALDELLASDSDSARIVALSGSGGVGKTALAVRWAHAVRDRFPDGQLHVDLGGYGPAEPLPVAEVLSGFLRALGVEGSEIPREVEQRAARFRSAVDGRRVLVVLDNARTVDQVRPLLPSASSCFALVTSRDPLPGLGVREGARRIDLDRFTSGEARLLLRTVLGDAVTAEPESIGRLVDQCARLPLALRIAAELAKARPARGVAGLVAELADERHRLDLLDVEDDSLGAVRAVFSWSYQQLPDDAARLFRSLGLHFGADADAYALSALLGSDLHSTRRALDRLIRARLVDEAPGERYQCHDLLRAYALELAEQTDATADRAAAVAQLLDYYAHRAAAARARVTPFERRRRASDAGGVVLPDFPDYADAMRWLDTERTNLVAAAEQSAEHAIALSLALRAYLEMGDHRDEAVRLHGRAVTAARELADRSAEADALRYLSASIRGLGRLEEAARLVERAQALYEELGDRSRLAAAMNSRGAISRLAGRQREAIGHYERAIALDADRPSAQVPAQVNLANAYTRIGDDERAFQHAERARSLAETHEHRTGQAHALVGLGIAAAGLGRLHEALDYAHRSLAFGEEHGVIAHRSAAYALLGTVHREQGDYSTSWECDRQALRLARRSSEKEEIAEALTGLGLTSRLAGRPGDAVRDLGQALDVAVAGGFRQAEANARVGLGDAYADLGHPEDAHEHWQAALEIFRELDLPDAGVVAAKLGLTGAGPGRTPGLTDGS